MNTMAKCIHGDIDLLKGWMDLSEKPERQNPTGKLQGQGKINFTDEMNEENKHLLFSKA